MAKLTNMNIASALAKDERISIKKSLFSTKAIYNPTNSTIHTEKIGLSPSDGEKVKSILLSKEQDLEKLIGKFHPKQVANGNYELEVCRSADDKFVALMLLHYFQLEYSPVTDMMTFEGERAKAIIKLL